MIAGSPPAQEALHSTAPALIGALAAFFAAAVNSIAGGGTFIAFPTLTGVLGLSEKLANATCTVGLWPGYAAGVAATWRELTKASRRAIALLVAVSLAGGAIGGALLLLTPAHTFRSVVPFLLGTGTILFAAGPAVNQWMGRGESHDVPSAAALPILLGVAIYNGYFGAGGGVLVIAGLAVSGMHDPRRANVFKMLIQVTSNAAAVAVLSWWGVAWAAASGMWLGALAGGWVGMRVANAIPRGALRAVIILAGVVLTIVYGWSALR